MALADILARIAEDARVEADAIAREAEEHAQATVAQARADAEARAAVIRETARRQAASEAETVVAAARLRARDRAVAARRELVERVLREAEERVAELPDDRYAEFVARGVLQAARGGESVAIAEADRARLAGRLEAAVARLAAEAGREIHLVYEDGPAPLAHGVLLAGERVRVEVSPASAVAAKRDEITMLAADLLFGGGE